MAHSISTHAGNLVWSLIPSNSISKVHSFILYLLRVSMHFSNLASILARSGTSLHYWSDRICFSGQIPEWSQIINWWFTPIITVITNLCIHLGDLSLPEATTPQPHLWLPSSQCQHDKVKPNLLMVASGQDPDLNIDAMAVKQVSLCLTAGGCLMLSQKACHVLSNHTQACFSSWATPCTLEGIASSREAKSNQGEIRFASSLLTPVKGTPIVQWGRFSAVQQWVVAERFWTALMH